MKRSIAQLIGAGRDALPLTRMTGGAVHAATASLDAPRELESLGPHVTEAVFRLFELQNPT